MSILKKHLHILVVAKGLKAPSFHQCFRVKHCDLWALIQNRKMNGKGESPGNSINISETSFSLRRCLNGPITLEDKTLLIFSCLVVMLWSYTFVFYWPPPQQPQQSPHRAPNRPLITCTAHSAIWIKPIISSMENRVRCQGTTSFGCRQVSQRDLSDR